MTHTYNGLGYRTETIRRQAEQHYQTSRTMQTETGIIQSEKADTQIHYHQDMLKPYFNLLIRKENGVARHFVWDNHLLSATTAEESAENSNRTWQENPGVMQTQPGQPSQPDRNSSTTYYLQDHQGSPIRIMDDAGMSLTKHAYDEFGNDIFTEEPDTAYTGEESITGEDLFGYTGYQREEDGLYYANARYYDPNAGRFVSEDIIKGSMTEPMSQNPYLYCWNQPMDYLDVDGKNPVALVIILLAVVAGTSGCGTEKEVEVINAEDIGLTSNNLPATSYSKDDFLVQKAKDQKAYNERQDQCENGTIGNLGTDNSENLETMKEIVLWDKITESRIQELHPNIRETVREFIFEVQEKGVYLRVADGYRSIEEQNALYNKGRNGNTEPKVTNVKGGYSYHNYGLAIDIYEIKDGEVV